MPSRAEIMDRARRLVAAAHADDALPPWRHDERTSDEAYRTLMDSGLYDVVPFLRSLQSGVDDGPFISACVARDIFEARREAVLTILAIEAFRRARGDWPASLTELSPPLPAAHGTADGARCAKPAAGDRLPRSKRSAMASMMAAYRRQPARAGRMHVRCASWRASVRAESPRRPPSSTCWMPREAIGCCGRSRRRLSKPTTEADRASGWRGDGEHARSVEHVRFLCCEQ